MVEGAGVLLMVVVAAGAGPVAEPVVVAGRVALCLLIFHNEIILETCEQCERKTTWGSGAAQPGSRPSTLAGTSATGLALLLPWPLIIRETPNLAAVNRGQGPTQPGAACWSVYFL